MGFIKLLELNNSDKITLELHKKITVSVDQTVIIVKCWFISYLQDIKQRYIPYQLMEIKSVVQKGKPQTS